MAFNWNGEKEDNYDIYVKLIGSERPLQLTTNPARDYSPAWSPDGRWIAFCRDLPGLEGRRVTDSTHRRTGTTADPDISHLPRYGRWTFSHLVPGFPFAGDSQWDGAYQPAGLFLFSVVTTKAKTNVSTNKRFKATVTLPSRRTATLWLFPDIASTGNSDLYLLNLSDDLNPIGDARHLTFTYQTVSSPVWTSDGNEIVFLSVRNEFRPVADASVETREALETRLRTGPGLHTGDFAAGKPPGLCSGKG